MTKQLEVEVSRKVQDLENWGRSPAWVLGALVVLAVALAFRLYGIGWDSGFLLHPDERFQLIVAVDRIREPGSFDELVSVSTSPWNPRRVGVDGRPQAFAYGALPLYVLETVGWLYDHGRVAFGLRTPPEDVYRQLAFRGRLLTALVDVIGIAIAMRLSSHLRGRAAALLTGAVLAGSVLAIQQAHFFVVDPWAATFGMATLYGCFRLACEGTQRWAVLTGLAFAAALASKASLWSLVVPIALAIGWRGYQVYAGGGYPSLLRAVLSATPWPVVAGTTVVAFAAFEPYSLADPAPMVRDLIREWQISRGALDVPYTRQYVGTVPVVYQIVQLARWGMGPVFAFLAAGATVSALVIVLRGMTASRSKVSRLRLTAEGNAFIVRSLLVSWIIAYILTTWLSETKYLRYSLPLLAPWAILVSDWLLGSWSATKRRTARSVRIVLIALLLIQVFAWAFAFSSIYRQEHTRIRASEWIYAHIPAGATLGVEHWDDRLPLPLQGIVPDQRYRFVSLNWYDDRTPEEALAYLREQLAAVDYIVLSSDRLAGSIPRLPWRYPVTSEYYRLLDSGALGFQLVYEGKLEAHLGPLRLDDYAADESFTVYDHPRVRIYQKVRNLTDEELRSLFAWALQQPYAPQRERPVVYKELLGAPADTIVPARDLGWAERWLTTDGVAIAWWALILIVLAAVGVPITVYFAPSFPDRGIGLARLLALLLVGYPVWLLASWHVLPFELPTILVSLAVVGIVSWWFGWRSFRAPGWQRHRSALVVSEVAFWSAFGIFLFLRWLYPDLWHPYFGGEKPMELAFTNAIARSRWMPPYDPWFADGVQNYYYYGFFLVALLWKLGGILPDRAFQLTLATFAGLVASVVASLGMELARRVLGTTSQRDRWIVLSAAGSVWWVLFAGNLDPLLQVIAKRSLAIDFWQSSRVVAHAITEFPYFSFLYADLHPHVLALPVWLGAVALLVAIHDADRIAWPKRVLGWVALVFWAGTAAVINSWDLPLASALVVLGTFVLLRPRSFRALLVLVALAGLGILSMRALYWPFYDRFVSPVTAIRPTNAGSAIVELAVHFGLLLALPIVALLLTTPPARRGTARVAALAALATAIGYGLGSMARVLAQDSFVFSVFGIWSIALPLFAFVAFAFGLQLVGLDARSPETMAYGVLLGLATGALGAWRPTASLVLVIAVLAGTWLLGAWRRAEAPVVALAVLGLATILAAELFLVVDDLFGSTWERMNTVFKFFHEAWPLLAISGWGAIVWAWTHRPRWSGFPRFASVLVAVVFVCSSLYVLLGTPQRLALRLPSTPTPGGLDGYAWMLGGQYANSVGETIETSEDYAVILWLRTHVRGNPVILEASIGPYRGNGSRISSATGLPTVLGWDRHERQQRTLVAPEATGAQFVSPLGDAVDRRLVEVRELYNTTDLEKKRELLARYRVRYVIVGAVERSWRIQAGFAGASVPNELYASPEGLAAFAALEGTTLQRVAQFGNTVIYEVSHGDGE
ncbi:DUF2298 domain-containing protein [Thermomicrobium sp. 4228-Ro]|uniref:DUF2298 domain-containing protein n=1 Tax=Thermomicrobium sp. 4228-Ro TaxID=2993937 RepID=UPI0022492EEF|nr:DUF2298 domain-containing protein [Thermomicrobium sp. 4228-Ro]MCX2726093.1 DUF2298 domain-containing protein [Thermomicrobium sp. 4228-Ro]